MTSSKDLRRARAGFRSRLHENLNQFRLSGASGRTSYEKIAPRPRRPMSEAERSVFLRSEHFARACELGGYPAEL